LFLLPPERGKEAVGRERQEGSGKISWREPRLLFGEGIGFEKSEEFGRNLLEQAMGRSDSMWNFLSLC